VLCELLTGTSYDFKKKFSSFVFPIYKGLCGIGGYTPLFRHASITSGVKLNCNKLLPVDDGPGLWQLQTEFMAEAEKLFGLRDKTKIIYQPSWDIDGPHVRYTPSKDGAFAELGFNAKTDWKMVVYQLAHETVHLLDQHGGKKTHLLEEGAAVRFSLDMMTKYGFDTFGLPKIESYQTALKLFNSLGEDPYYIAKVCREICGNFISIDEMILKAKCPEINGSVIEELLSKPVMR
jgi:hypothetical protein